MTARYTRPEPITASHQRDKFDCGEQTLNSWLHKRALPNEASGATRTFVACVGDAVAGYYSLAVSALHRKDATGSVRRNMPEPIPAMLLARLAVDRAEQGRGLGRHLLRDALLRTLGAAQSAGIRVMLVHALDAEAADFYRRFGFEGSPTDPVHLMLSLKDIGETVRKYMPV